MDSVDPDYRVFFPTQTLLVTLVLWWIDRHKYQSLQAPPKIKADQIGAGGFTWRSFEKTKLPRILRPEREASGLMWAGLAAGVSNKNGKAGVIAVWLFGSNEGVGHYACVDRIDKTRCNHSDGHFHLKVYAKAGSLWETEVLRGALERIARDVGRFYRPLSTFYDAKSKKVEWYDDESGREVYFREDGSDPSGDLFFFGPYPKKLKNFADDTGTPGITTMRVERAWENHPRMIIWVRDIYGQPLKYARVEVEGAESDFNHAQVLPADGGSITAPYPLQKLMVRICRQGYGTITEEIDVAAGDIKVEAILEPVREDE